MLMYLNKVINNNKYIDKIKFNKEKEKELLLFCYRIELRYSYIIFKKIFLILV